MVMMEWHRPGLTGPVRLKEPGGTAVAPVDRRFVSRALIAGALVATLGLTACGRKGPLAPPPAATAKAADPGKPNAPKDHGPTKPFILDPLL